VIAYNKGDGIKSAARSTQVIGCAVGMVRDKPGPGAVATAAPNTGSGIVLAPGTVRVFQQKSTLKDAIGSHACSLEASRHVTNGIPLGRPLPLTGTTVNSVQTLKVLQTR
jgi:hypothetical protein